MRWSTTPGKFRGIALLEVLYKLVSTIINSRLKRTINFDDSIHGFRAGRGTGTAITEAKLRMQLHASKSDPLYIVFVDLNKAYDTLDRTQASRILQDYSDGPALINFIERIWEGGTIYPKRSGYYGKSFRARQGDIISSMLFNTMLDAVVRNWSATKRGDDKCGFYTDDNILAGLNSTHVQEGLDIVTASFATI